MSYQFQVGQVFTSPAVKAELTDGQLIAVLRQHVSGEWDSDIREANEQAVLNGSQIFSKCRLRGKKRQQLTIWILTDECRTKTLVMFPRDSAYRASDLGEVPGPLLHRGLIFP